MSILLEQSSPPSPPRALQRRPIHFSKQRSVIASASHVSSSQGAQNEGAHLRTECEALCSPAPASVLDLRVAQPESSPTPPTPPHRFTPTSALPPSLSLGKALCFLCLACVYPVALQRSVFRESFSAPVICKTACIQESDFRDSNPVSIYSLLALWPL